MNQSRFQGVSLLYARDDASGFAGHARGRRADVSREPVAPISTVAAKSERSSRPASPLTHAWIWRAIDTLASRHGLTPSGLARLAGLDPTAFNPSKRCTPEGRHRWPSTESISKLLEATATSLDEFASIDLNRAIDAAPANATNTAPGDPQEVAVVATVRDAVVVGWSARAGAEAKAGQCFGLSVADASLEPVYSRGHTLIVSTGEPVRPGDRVVVKPSAGSPLPRIFLARRANALTFAAFHPDQDEVTLEQSAVEWMARIVWARQ